MVKNIKLIMFMNIELKTIKRMKMTIQVKAGTETFLWILMSLVLLIMINLVLLIMINMMMIQVKAGTETFLWQLEGSAVVTYGNGEQVV